MAMSFSRVAFSVWDFRRNDYSDRVLGRRRRLLLKSEGEEDNDIGPGIEKWIEGVDEKKDGTESDKISEISHETMRR